MGFIEDELSDVRKLCENVVLGSRLVTCIPTLVRVEIKRTNFKRCVICIQFPPNYPKEPLLLEIKSKTFSDNFINKLTSICEIESKKYLGKSQILPVLKFIRTFIDDTPLSCCYDEIINLKKLLNDQDEFKLRQKTSTILLKVFQGLYFVKCKLEVSDNYPYDRVRIDDFETNFPPFISRHILAQAREISRQCVEAPLRKRNPNQPAFKESPSLEPVAKYLINCLKVLPNEKCQACNLACLPVDPKDIQQDESSPRHVERVYCGHLFHLECLLGYLKKPPFQNKKCPNVNCGKSIFHSKWGLSDKLAEDRWAHEQARERELAEVTDFFK